MTNIRSGDILSNYFNVTILDSFGEVVKIFRENYNVLLYLTDNNDPPSLLVNEFWFTSLQVLFDDRLIKLEGDL